MVFKDGWCMSGSGLALSLPLRAEHTAELCRWIAPAKPVDLIIDPERGSCRGVPGLLNPLLRQARGGRTPDASAGASEMVYIFFARVHVCFYRRSGSARSFCSGGRIG